MQESCAIRPYENAVTYCSMCGLPLSEDYLIEFGTYHVCYGCFVSEGIEDKHKTGAPAIKRERKTAHPARKTVVRPQVKKPPHETNPLNYVIFFFISLVFVGYIWFFKGNLITSENWDSVISGIGTNVPQQLTTLNADFTPIYKTGSTLGLTSEVTKCHYADYSGETYLSIMKIVPSWFTAIYKLYIVQVTNRLHGLGLSPQGGDKYTMVDAKNNIARTLIFQPGLVIVLESVNLSAVHHQQAVNEALEALNK
jgi:hypothetical protein